MKLIHWAAMAALSLAVGSDALAQTQAPAAGPFTNTKSIVAWASKPARLPPYTGPNKLVYRLTDVLAAHKGKASWTQTVFDSRDFTGEWISMAPGEKTKT